MTTTVTVCNGKIVGYLTAAEYAKKHGIPEVTIRVWVKNGKIDGIKIGGNTYIKEDLVPPKFEKPGRKRMLGIVTNEDWIKSLSVEQLAHELIRMAKEPDYGDPDDCWATPFFNDVYITSDDMTFFDDYDGALNHEIFWLKQRRGDAND